MKSRFPICLCFCLTAAGLLPTQASQATRPVEVRADPEFPAVFAGPARLIHLVLRNTGQVPVDIDLRARLHQLSSATAVPLGEIPCKRVRVLAGQTVCDSASLMFPNVRSETRFLIQWVESTNRFLGSTEVLVYPPDLLKELGILAGDGGVGVLDPLDEIKPLLRLVRIDFVDLGEVGFERFSGKLSIVGPFAPQTKIGEDLVDRIEGLARRGAGLVWIQPPPGLRAKLLPSFYAVPLGKGAVVVVQPALFSDLSHHPTAQLNLVHLCRLALHPESSRLPRTETEP
jgi:hypothetical protein